MDAGEELATADALASSILQGDPNAEGLLYARYHRQLVMILRGRGVPQNLQEDIAHEAYIVTLQRLRAGELEQPELLGRYLKRTAINLWLNEVRKSIRHGDVPLDSAADADALRVAEDGSSEAEAIEMSAMVREIVAELSQERDRQVLLLTFVHDWDKQRVCKHLNLEPRAYDNVRSRAIKRCREILARHARLRQSMQSAMDGGLGDDR